MFAYLPQERSTTPWVLVLSQKPNITANLITRGSFPVNIVHLVPTLPEASELHLFGTDMATALMKSDGLAVPNYVGALQPGMPSELNALSTKFTPSHDCL